MACNTISGPDANQPCIFPFTFSNNIYSSCTTDFNDAWDTNAWCSTKVDKFGVHVGGEGNWGYCDPKCQTNLSGKYNFGQTFIVFKTRIVGQPYGTPSTLYGLQLQKSRM